MDSVALSFDSCHTVSAFNTAIGNIKSQLQLKNWLHIKDGEKFKLSQLIQIFDRCVTSYKDVVIPTLTAFSCNIQRLFPHEMYDNEDQIYLQYFFEKMSIYSEASTYPWVAALIPDISQQTQYNFDDVLKKHIKILNQSLEDRYHQCLNYKLDSTSLPIMLRRLQEILSFLHMEVSFMKLSCTETEITLLAMTLKKLAISQNPSVAFEPKSNMQLSCNGESNELKDVEFMRELYEDSEMWGLYLSIISNLSRIHFMGDDETIYRTLSKLETQAKTFKETTKNKKFSDLLKHYLIYISFEKMHALGNIISTELFTCVKIINRSKFIKSSYAPVTTFSTPMCSLTLTMLNHFSRVFSYQIKFANLGVTKAESHEQFYRYRKAINDMWLKYSEQQKQFYFLVLEKLKGLIAPKHDIETSLHPY
jgi:energy-converting hydrogenase Eha subunit A